MLLNKDNICTQSQQLKNRIQLCEAKLSVADEKSGNTSEPVIIHSKLEYMHGPGHDTKRAAEKCYIE